MWMTGEGRCGWLQERAGEWSRENYRAGAKHAGGQSGPSLALCNITAKPQRSYTAASSFTSALHPFKAPFCIVPCFGMSSASCFAHRFQEREEAEAERSRKAQATMDERQHLVRRCVGSDAWGWLSVWLGLGSEYRPNPIFPIFEAAVAAPAKTLQRCPGPPVPPCC